MNTIINVDESNERATAERSPASAASVSTPETDHMYTNPGIRHVPFNPLELSAWWTINSRILRGEKCHRLFLRDVRMIEYDIIVQKYRMYFTSLQDGEDDDYRELLMIPTQINYADLRYAPDRLRVALRIDDKVQNDPTLVDNYK